MLYLPAVMHQRRATRPDRCPSPLRRLALAVALLAVAPAAAPAHEIPQRVAVLGFVRAQGTRVEVLLRVPLESMRDVDFPLQPDGALDLMRVRPLLGGAAQQWLADYLALEADGAPLDAPRVLGARVACRATGGSSRSARRARSWTFPALGNVVPLPWRQALLDVRLEVAPCPRRAHGSCSSPHSPTSAYARRACST